MAMPRHSAPSHRLPPRGGLVLMLVAWLGLLVAPCLPAAAAPAPGAGSVHCDHMGPAGEGHHADGMPCAEMQAEACAIPYDVSSDGPRPAPAPRGNLLLTLPVEAAAPAPLRARARPGDRTATGPPLAIRYCTFLN